MKPILPPVPQTDPRRSAYAVMAMVAAVVIPATLTLVRVVEPAELVIASPDPTPRGYTWSLLLFILPATVLGLWFWRHPEHRLPKRAFWRTITLLTPLGIVLDFVFGSIFLTFKNKAATVGWLLPAVGGRIPIEEYVFYFTGFLVVLLMYAWADEYWMAAYNVADYRAEAAGIPRLIMFHKESLLVGAALLVAAVTYKNFSAQPKGFPGYFTFLVVAAFLPSAGFFRVARPFINWRAFSLTMFMILLVSLLWEVTLAVPYQWWGYNPDAMVGLYIGAWSELPIEAVCVWVAVTYTTVITYEVIKIWQASERPLRDAMLGQRKAAPPPHSPNG